MRYNDMSTEKTIYTCGVSGWGGNVVVEGKLANSEKIKYYRRYLLGKISEELDSEDRDCLRSKYSVKKLNDSYNKELIPFISNNNGKDVWMKDASEIFEDKQIAEEYVEKLNTKMANSIRDILSTDLQPLMKETDLEYSLNYSVKEKE